MKTAGIIAEYNPFHNGHKYHLEEVRRQTGADYLIIVMSGDFTQRGIPAVINKYSRARMALDAGVDLVLELPVCYATGSAAWFAQGAICLLDSLGCVDLVSFGSECGDIDRLTAMAKILSEEPTAFTETLKHGLKEGLSYPTAREKALQSVLSAAASQEKTLRPTLSNPNDILGVEYCKALLEINSAITPHTVRRLGGAYDDPELQAQNSSALAIRTALYRGDSAIQDRPTDGLVAIRDQVPPHVYNILSGEFNRTFPIFPDMLSAQLHYKLIS
ncbi:MAG: nucleotidyltransferase family protein, partial [Lachnospiraceae bacterium]|nr:nucleotidyltransferase family protein [Lachnospiraceae bacterium]